MHVSNSCLRHILACCLIFGALNYCFVPHALACHPKSVAGAEQVSAVVPNDNRVPAGKLEAGILNVDLEIQEGRWFPEADAGPSLTVQVFAEKGKQPQIPGPLIRVPQGTEIHAAVHNALQSGTAVVYGLQARPGGQLEPVSIPAGQTREMRFKLDVPGTYYYWASTTGEPLETREGIDSLLTGALVVDASNAAFAERIFAINKWASPHPLGHPLRRVVFAINGKSWPHNEKLTARLGEEVRWRWINTTNRSHPMHMHGSYFRVDSKGNDARDSIYGVGDRRMVVTERMPIGGTMTMTWVPETAGRWIFHCHIQAHFSTDLGLDGAEPPAPHTESGAGMKGLVMGITVLPAGAGGPPAPQSKPRQLRLLVGERPATWDAPKAHVYQLQEGNEQPALDKATVPGSPIVLTRGEPVEITVVNQLKQPTAVHWHGIEIESYYDGVPDWGGVGNQVTPPIAPGESFLVRITPKRAGTFIYHTHWHDPVQLSTGLYGPLLVLEPGQKLDPERDKTFIISRGGTDNATSPVLLNGSVQPAAQRLAKGVKYRLRFINISDNLGDLLVSLFKEGSPVSWRPIAKDGAQLPASQQIPKPAQQVIAVGETYDFEFQPESEGDLQLELVRGPVSKARLVAILDVH